MKTTATIPDNFDASEAYHKKKLYEEMKAEFDKYSKAKVELEQKIGVLYGALMNEYYSLFLVYSQPNAPFPINVKMTYGKISKEHFMLQDLFTQLYAQTKNMDHHKQIDLNFVRGEATKDLASKLK